MEWIQSVHNHWERDMFVLIWYRENAHVGGREEMSWKMQKGNNIHNSRRLNRSGLGKNCSTQSPCWLGVW